MSSFYCFSLRTSTLDTRQFNRKVNKTCTRLEAFVLDFAEMLTKINLSDLLSFSKSNQESLRFLLILLEKLSKNPIWGYFFKSWLWSRNMSYSTSMSDFEEFFSLSKMNGNERKVVLEDEHTLWEKVFHGFLRKLVVLQSSTSTRWSPA